jgi:O-antigen chain-terminating methyltransferase
VEPRWGAQHELDAEIARFADDAVLAARRLHVEVRDARLDIDALRREVAALKRTVDRGRDTTNDRLAEVDRQVREIADMLRAVDTRQTEDAREREDAMASLKEAVARQQQFEQLVVDRASAADVAILRGQVEQLMERLGVAAAHGAEFDYVAFEDRFRGGSEHIAETQREYVTKFPPADGPGAIADIGCGRGEMLEVLQGCGYDVVGVDVDERMLAVCRAKGLHVVRADGASWLEAQLPGSLKGIFCAQVVEHLLTPELERLVRASLEALRTGGVLVMETINPRSLHALGNHFFADVSHVRPVHPETLRFMCEQAGFESVALMEMSEHPVVEEAKALGTEPIDDAVRELVSSVFGFQDYAIVATKGK